jgi:hypothetical protein
MNLLRTACLALIAVVATTALAEQQKDYDGFVVQYSAIHSVDLSPEIARKYGIHRDGRHALVMINVQRKTANGIAPGAIAARLSGRARNITGQVQPLAMREIREGADVYYLGEITVENLDLMTFELEITPRGSDQVLPLRFEQRFYVD